MCSSDLASLSIAHQELRLAIELKKPRWLLAHENILTARTLFARLGHEGVEGRKALKLKRSDVLEDLRLIDMYEEATFDRLPLAERIGNWVQKIHSADDAGRYILSQFFRYQEVLAFVEEHFRNGTPLLEGQADR